MRRGTQVLVRAVAGVVALSRRGAVRWLAHAATRHRAGHRRLWPSTLSTIDAAIPTTAPVDTTLVHDHGSRRTTTTVAPTTTTPEPTTTTVPAPVIDPNCPTHAARRGDRSRPPACLAVRQRCRLARVRHHHGPRAARPGDLPGVRKSMHASSRFGGHYSTMTHFVAFTRGEKTGARVAFHTVPVLRRRRVRPTAGFGRYPDGVRRVVGLHPGAARAGSK